MECVHVRGNIENTFPKTYGKHSKEAIFLHYAQCNQHLLLSDLQVHRLKFHFGKMIQHGPETFKFPSYTLHELEQH